LQKQKLSRVFCGIRHLWIEYSGQKGFRMTRLDSIQNWTDLARENRYNCEELAAAVRVSERHLRRYFAEALGIRLHDWMIRQRYDHAAVLLSSGAPIKEVLDHIGITDQSHVSRHFKKLFGTSISQMRRRLVNQARTSAKHRMKAAKPNSTRLRSA